MMSRRRVSVNEEFFGFGINPTTVYWEEESGNNVNTIIQNLEALLNHYQAPGLDFQ